MTQSKDDSLQNEVAPADCLGPQATIARLAERGSNRESRLSRSAVHAINHLSNVQNERETETAKISETAGKKSSTP
jgi:hypothetical protein